MDNVYRPDCRSEWVGQEKIHIREYFETYQSVLSSVLFRADLVRLPSDRTLMTEKKFDALLLQLDESKVHDEGTLMNQAGIDLALLNEIKEQCDIKHLTIENELPPMVYNADYMESSSDPVPVFSKFPIPEEGLGSLQTLAQRNEYLNTTPVPTKYKRLRLLRHANNNWYDAMPPKPERLGALVEKEVLLVARVYRPTKPTTRNTSSASNQNSIRYHQEIHVLGSNKLSELRDFIKCPTDETVCGEVSENPYDEKNKKKAKDVYHSGFMFFGDTFYNDMRWPDSIDLSETVRNWAASGSNRGIGPFKTALMEETTFNDLEIRLGYPYVYVHQGNHEHMISFNDVRLLSVDDPQLPSQYPYERSTGTKHSKFCMACSTIIAKWVVTHNTRLPEDPYFFCDECFRSYNYTSDGKKIGNFKAYPFVDVNAL